MPSLLLIVSLALSWGCGDRGGPPGGGKGGPPSDGGTDAQPPSPVEVVKVETGPITDGLWATATVKARDQAEIRSRAGGIVEALDVEEGAAVKAGDRLARIDQPAYVSLIAKAKASVEKARRDLRSANALKAKGVLPAQQAEDAEFQLRQARLEVRRLEEERRLGTVSSPIDGVVISRAAERGEAISPGAPLFVVADLAALEAELFVPERHLARITAGLLVDVTAEGIGEARMQGRIVRIAPTVDPRSGTVKVTVSLGDGRIDDTRRLRPGMYIRTRIVVDTRDEAILVPRRAIIYENDRPFAFRVADGKAEKLTLELGYTDRDRVEVRSPVVAGDEIIVFGQRGLEDGASVKVVAAPGEAAPAPASEDAPSARGDRPDGERRAKRRGEKKKKRATEEAR